MHADKLLPTYMTPRDILHPQEFWKDYHYIRRLNDYLI